MDKDELREFYKGLRERIHQLRMGHLFEEPCPLYEEDDDFWNQRMTYDYDDDEDEEDDRGLTK